MATPKPKDQLNPAAPASNRRVPWASVIGFVGLAVNFALCVHRAKGDRGAIAFTAFCYLNLLVLFWCIRQFEQSPPGSAARGRIMATVWLLATSLTKDLLLEGNAEGGWKETILVFMAWLCLRVDLSMAIGLAALEEALHLEEGFRLGQLLVLAAVGGAVECC